MRQQILRALHLYRPGHEDLGGEGIALWDQEDGFYYDALHLPDGAPAFLKVRSMVGLIPLFAVETLEPEMLVHLQGLSARACSGF